jgi:hypothetical protein
MSWLPVARRSRTLVLRSLIATFGVKGDTPMMKNDTAVFHAFAWNPVTVRYDDWRGMGTPSAIAERSFEAQGPVHYCPRDWLNDGWLDKPKGR